MTVKITAMCALTMSIGMLGCRKSAGTPLLSQLPPGVHSIDVDSHLNVTAISSSHRYLGRDAREWESFVCEAVEGVTDFRITDFGLLTWGKNAELAMLVDGKERQIVAPPEGVVRGAYVGERVLLWGLVPRHDVAPPSGVGTIWSSANGHEWRADIQVDEGEIVDLSLASGERIIFLTSAGAIYRARIAEDGGVLDPTRIGFLKTLTGCVVKEFEIVACPARDEILISGDSSSLGTSLAYSSDFGRSWTSRHMISVPIAAHYLEGKRQVFVHATRSDCSVRLYQGGVSREISSVCGLYLDSAISGNELFVLTSANGSTGPQIFQISIPTGTVREFP